MKKILPLTLCLVAAVFAVVVSTATPAASATPSDAAVTTDKTDYQPGETVVISGSGFAAGELVSITLKETPANHADTALSATADEYGNFVNKDFSPTEEHLGTTFDLKAVGQTSGRTAEARFNDGPNWSYSSVPNPATFGVTTDGAPHSVTATVNVIAPDTGNGKPSASNVITVAPQISPGANPIPAAWIAPLPNLTFNTSPQTLPWTFVVTVPPYSAPGTYSSMLKANPPPAKGGPGSGINITVVVTADDAAPNTSLSAANADSSSYTGVNWTNQDVTVTLSATDTGTPTTGVAWTKYSLDGGPYQTYASPFTVSPEGLHTLLYQSQDFQGNLEVPAKSFTVKIDKTKPVITLSGGDLTLYYGDTFTDPGSSATDSGGSGLAGAVSVTGSVDTNVVGDYTLSYDVSDTAGNAADTATRTVHVLKASQTITFAPLADKTYGDAPFNVSAAGGLSGGPVTFSTSGDCTNVGDTVTITGAGLCTVTASQAGNANYDPAADVSQSFNIAKAATTTAVTCAAGPFVYNGSPHTPCFVSVTGPAGLSLTPAPVYADNVNAGTATASYTFAGDDDYLPSTDSENFTIDKANATINVTGYTGFYDGAAHGATGTATGVLGEDLTSLLDLGAPFTNVPGGTANWSFAGNSNYNSATGSVSIVIKAWTLTGFYQPVDMSPTGGPVLLNTVKGGSTVPLKFEIFVGTAERTSTADIQSFQFQEFVCGSASSFESPIEVTTTGGTSLRYDLTGGQFIQNWQTPKTAGKCYQVRMTAQDGSKIDAYFKTK